MKPDIVTHDGIFNLKCRHGCKEAIVGVYAFPDGCVCLDDQVQVLCVHHMLRAKSNILHGEMIPLITFA